jgi:stalled ribosome rescue protein Dom34
MTLKAGLWIDHREARVVFISDSGEEHVRRVESNVEKHVRAAGGSRSSTPYGPQDVAAGDVQERKLTHHLNAYYEEVIELLRDANAIFVFGPGEAKGEFQKQIKSKAVRQRIAAVETVDKMTERQIVAKVREFFGANKVQ